MAKYLPDLDSTFAALADPTRRAIVSRLCEGPQSVSELSRPFDMALPSLLKHVRVLEQSGLVSSEKTGRVRTCRIEPHALQATESWIHRHVTAWEKRLDRLEAHIHRMKMKRN
jgi:DNA-binding transcriptional ArsR family regulator